MKIGSLFDGSGGFPLAASMCGIEPVWAAEVEPYPIAVTRSRFPRMKHLGSVTDVKGNEVDPVDVITFGSPCQDLSVAGKRAGLKHTENGDEETTRSGLFMEAVRIIKEMREATNGEYPRYAVWENVPGAFSSNKGLDFRVVLEELIRIAEPTAVMPEVPKAGWPYADVYCGDGWSLAYRVLDAQYWGVPQRRRRIYLVADFRGQRAGKISFEREGLRGYFAQSGSQRKAVAGDAESGIGAADRDGNVCVNVMNPWDSQGNQVHDGTGNNVYPTLRGCGGAGYQAGYVLADCYGIDHAITTGGNCTAQGPCVYENIQATLKASGVHAVCYALDQQGGKGGANYAEDVMPTLCSDSHGTPHAVAYGVTTKGNGDAFISEERHTSLSTGGGQPGQGYPRAMQPVPYTLKIRGGVEVDSAGKAAGKGALIQKNMSATLGVSQDQYLFQPCIKTYDARGNGDGDIASTITGDHESRITDYTSVVVEPIAYNGENVTSPLNKTNPQPGDPCHTLGTDSRNYVVIPIHDQATRFSGKRGDNSDGKGNGLGVGNPGDPMNTLTSGDRHSVAYSVETFHCVTEEEKTTTLKARDYKDPAVVVYPAYWDGGQTCGTLTANNAGGNQRMPDKDNFNCVISIDRAAFNQGKNALYSPQYLTDGTTPTLVAQGPSAVAHKTEVRYIVRRLTPTECARLQGFPDEWGHPDVKTELTDEEYAFWLNVRNTHAAINDKAVKEYTREQMLTWYNKLHTDSSEYKLWGNGIALPCALYVMQGIAEVNAAEPRN